MLRVARLGMRDWHSWILSNTPRRAVGLQRVTGLRVVWEQLLSIPVLVAVGAKQAQPVCQPRRLVAGKRQHFTVMGSVFCDSAANSQSSSLRGLIIIKCLEHLSSFDLF